MAVIPNLIKSFLTGVPGRQRDRSDLHHPEGRRPLQGEADRPVLSQRQIRRNEVSVFVEVVDVSLAQIRGGSFR